MAVNTRNAASRSSIMAVSVTSSVSQLRYAITLQQILNLLAKLTSRRLRAEMLIDTLDLDALPVPTRHFLDRPFDDPARQRFDQAGLFCQWHKLIRGNKTASDDASAAMPRHPPPSRYGYLPGLEIQLQLLGVQRITQITHQASGGGARRDSGREE